MISLKDEKVVNSYRRVLIVGYSGSGKTTLLRTAPYPFIADFDCKGKGTLSGIDGYYESYGPPDGWARFSHDIRIFKEKGLPAGVQTVCLDSLTFAADRSLEWALKENGRPEGAAIQQGDWGKAIDEIKKKIFLLNTLPCHTIVTAHLALEKDQVLGGIVWQPLIYGKALPNQLPVYFNDVWNTFIESSFDAKSGKSTNKYLLRVVPDQQLKLLKNDSHGKFLETESPNFSDLIAKVS